MTFSDLQAKVHFFHSPFTKWLYVNLYHVYHMTYSQMLSVIEAVHWDLDIAMTAMPLNNFQGHKGQNLDICTERDSLHKISG